MEGQPNLKGVVIIKLPPPESSFEGKSIAGAVAFADEPGHGSLTQEEQGQDEGIEDYRNFHLPLHHNQVLSRHRHRRRIWTILSKRLAVILFLVVLGSFFWQYAPLSLEFEEDDSKPKEETERPMVYSLYSKMALTSGANSSLSFESAPQSTPISPSAISRLVERDVVHNSRAEIAAVASPDSKETFTTLFPLRGNVYPNGLYYVAMAIGNPPREYYLDMDTGSELTWLQCDAPCSHCAQGPHPLYKPRKSNLVDCGETICSSVQAGGNFGCSDGSRQCDYDIMYADGGYSLGVLVNDKMILRLTNRSLTQTQAVFGCAYDQQGSLAKSPAPTDGVLGLSSSMVSLPAQWAHKGLIKNIIAHCMSGSGRGGGYLFFGDKLLPSRGITWTPMLGKPSMKHYAAAIESVYVGNTRSSIAGNAWGTAIFDSGTSYSYLVPPLYTAVVSLITKNLIGTELNQDTSDNTLPLCWQGPSSFKSLEDIQHLFKPITFEFKATGWFMKTSRLHLSPEGYLFVNSKGNVCLGVLNTDTLKSNGANIIGDISMQGHLMIYDNENNRIGWIKTDCRKIPNAAALSPSL